MAAATPMGMRLIQIRDPGDRTVPAQGQLEIALAEHADAQGWEDHQWQEEANQEGEVEGPLELSLQHGRYPPFRQLPPFRVAFLNRRRS